MLVSNVICLWSGHIVNCNVYHSILVLLNVLTLRVVYNNVLDNVDIILMVNTHIYIIHVQHINQCFWLVIHHVADS